MKKKLTALLAVFLMTVSILPTGADAVSAPSITIYGGYTDPDVAIMVTVPSSTSAYINPEKVSVNLGSTYSKSQILSSQAYIENQSAVPVQVNVAVTGSVRSTSTLKLSETSTAGQTSKLAFVYLQMKAVDDPGKFATWDSEFDASQDIVLSTTETREKSAMVTLAAYSEDDHYGLFRLSGDCVASPKNDPWKSRDTFTAQIVFTFTALPLT
jgi:hypothetical protein